MSYTGNKAPGMTTPQQCPDVLTRNHSLRTRNVPSCPERARGTSGDPQKAPESDVFGPPGSARAQGRLAGGAPSRLCTPGSLPCSCLGFGREVGGMVWIFLGAQMSPDVFL